MWAKHFMSLAASKKYCGVKVLDEKVATDKH